MHSHSGQAMGASAVPMLRRASNSVVQSGQQYSYSGMSDSIARASRGFYTGLAFSSRPGSQRLFLACLVLLGLLNTGWGPPVLTDGGWPPLRLYPHEVEALGRVASPPQGTARAALLADARTRAILFQSGASNPLPPASTTKIMTALLALEQAGLDDLVGVPEEALAVGEASMWLVPGEQLTLRDLLYGLLLVSANDAAVTVAIHVGGSTLEFVGMMNERAASLGMTSTHFANPHGLDDPDHLSSAMDLLTLTLEALQHPEFARIVATTSASVAGRHLSNTNELLASYEGAAGVKTGTTDVAGQCLVASAVREHGEPIVVILGSEDRYSEARALLDFYYANYSWRELVLPTDRLSQYADENGQGWTLSLAERKAAVLPNWQWPRVHLYRWLEPAGQLSSRDTVGRARFTLGHALLAEVPLLAEPRE